MEILESEKRETIHKKIYFKLREFHLKLNFLGCIRRTLQGPGLKEIFEVICAEKKKNKKKHTTSYSDRESSKLHF